MVRGAATRNRTYREKAAREECIGLEEIDEHATKANKKKMDRNDLLILNMGEDIIHVE